MVRASLSKATAEAVDPSQSTTSPQAERVQQLGEHIEQSLKIHSPSAEEQAEQTATAGLAGGGSHGAEAERLRIPFTAKEVNGFVFVRTEYHDCAPPCYEAAVFFNGNCVSSVGNCPTRIEAIITVESDLYRVISRTEAFRDEARELNAIVHALRNLSEGEPLPKGEACEWPLQIEDQADEQGVILPPPAAGLAGEGEVVAVAEQPAVEQPAVGPSADAPTVAYPPEPTDAQLAARESLERIVAERRYHDELDGARRRHNEAGLYRLELEDELKSAKKREKTALEELRDIGLRGPVYSRHVPPAGSSPSSTTSSTPAFPSHDPLPPPVHPEHAAGSNSESSTSPQAGEAQPSPAPSTSTTGTRDDWATVDIDALNLPASLTAKLREACCPTIGKLESLRGSFDGLKSIDGIGQAKADAIEEAVLGWLSKNRDSSVITAARESAIAGESVALEVAAQGQ